MIAKSLLYKLVRTSDNIIIAEGSAKVITSLRKKNPGTFVGVGSLRPQIGMVFGNPSNYTMIQKDPPQPSS